MTESKTFQTLSPAAQLALCDRGRALSHPRRALALLAAASDLDVEHLERLSIGSRDAALLRVHQLTFGDRLACAESCPSCDQRLELEVALSALLATQPERVLASFEVAGRVARLPDSLDVERALASAHEPRHALARACLGGEPGELDDALVASFEQACAELDPLADIRLQLSCAACQHGWLAAFDVTTVLWNACAASGSRLLREVHEIASAYNWSEQAILALPQQRRTFYLECIAGQL